MTIGAEKVYTLGVIDLDYVLEYLGLTEDDFPHGIHMALDGWTYGDTEYTLINADDFFQALYWEDVLDNKRDYTIEFKETFGHGVYINLEG